MHRYLGGATKGCGLEVTTRLGPVDHYFDWEQGRVLSTYQLVYVTEGQGTFESDASPKCHRIETGTVMTLFPGVWHRYAPNPKTGWVEQWIECCGPAFDRARDANLLRPEQPVWEVGLPSELLQAFERCHALAQQRSVGVQALLSTMGLHLLAILLRVRREHPGSPRPIDHKVQRAQEILSRRYHEHSIHQRLIAKLPLGRTTTRRIVRFERTVYAPILGGHRSATTEMISARCWLGTLLSWRLTYAGKETVLAIHPSLLVALLSLNPF